MLHPHPLAAKLVNLDLTTTIIKTGLGRMTVVGDSTKTDARDLGLNAILITGVLIVLVGTMGIIIVERDKVSSRGGLVLTPFLMELIVQKELHLHQLNLKNKYIKVFSANYTVHYTRAHSCYSIYIFYNRTCCTPI